MIHNQNSCHKQEDLNGSCQLDDRGVQGRAFKLHAILNKCGLLLNANLRHAVDLVRPGKCGTSFQLAKHAWDYCCCCTDSAVVHTLLPARIGIKQCSMCNMVEQQCLRNSAMWWSHIAMQLEGVRVTKGTYSHGSKASSESCTASKLVNGTQGTPVTYCHLWKQIGIQPHQILHDSQEAVVGMHCMALHMHQDILWLWLGLICCMLASSHAHAGDAPMQASTQELHTQPRHAETCNCIGRPRCIQCWKQRATCATTTVSVDAPSQLWGL